METTIRKLFSDQDRKFRIPAYQRAYSWEKEHILQLIQDLRDASQDYYLGHFLFEQDQTATKASAANTLLIIDGQQRLTTCIIFFSSLYQELIKKKSAGEVGSIDLEDIVHIYLRDTRKGTQKLETVVDDNNFFADEVIDRKHTLHPAFGTKSQERIRDARVLFSEAFSKATLAELERWHGLVSAAKCTEYRVADKVGAARIFAFQNDRGKPLSDLEKLKSYFMLQVYLHGGTAESQAEHIEYLEREISTIYRQIVRVDLGEDVVLRYCWQASSHSKGFDSDKTLDEVKAHITGGLNSDICERIKGFITALANSFRLVEEVENSEATEIKNLRYLNTMALAYPFLMRARLHGASEKQVERLASLLENVTFRALLRGGRAGIESRLNDYLTTAADEHYVETLVRGIVHDLRNEGWWRYWSDEVLEVLDGGYFYKNRVDNYLLWRYEMHLCSKTGYSVSKINYGNLISNESIEHIAPQTETDGDPVANGYGVYEDVQNPENGIVSGEWMNCLGNLMLISQSHNSSIGNKPFETKVASYGKDNLLNQQKEIIRFVTDNSKPVWDKAAIERRHGEIVGVARALWSLDNL